MNITKQELFDKAVTAALKQGELEPMHFRACSYLRDNGQRCIIGCLIPLEVLEEVRASKDNSTITDTISHVLAGDNPIANYLKQNYELRPGDHAFLSELQSVNDGSNNMENFIDELRSFAVNNELNTLVLDEITL